MTAKRRERRERGGEIQNPQGSIRGLLQVNVATTHFLASHFEKGMSNDVFICCLIVGIAEGNLRRHVGSHPSCTHIKMQKESRQGGGGWVEGRVGGSWKEMEERQNITRSKHSFILENPIF